MRKYNREVGRIANTFVTERELAKFIYKKYDSTNTKKTKKSVIPVTESALVEMMEKIVEQAVEEAVTQKKKEWIAEQKNTDKKNTLLETRLNKIENFLSKATITKKK